MKTFLIEIPIKIISHIIKGILVIRIESNIRLIFMVEGKTYFFSEWIILRIRLRMYWLLKLDLKF
jgi:hypothetical protein